ncbi:MAG: hypothetical protein B9S32_14705 [Verrucomicrobia bacterium Tous-C9LFEB]|nr:MAG: hypothetical protein B9S32_14705 [Verrucomicrobia bacterium Tous-C9LFEB]
MFRQPTLLKRHPANPIIKPADFPFGSADVVFNPGQIMYNGKTILLLSILLRNQAYARVHVAESDNGVDFTINPEPAFTRDPERRFGDLDNHPIDCRITQIGDTYYIIRPGNSPKGCIDLMYKTTDFKTFEFMDIVALPHNRVPCLFPEKVGGYYVRLDRPYGGAGQADGNIWLSKSPDLIHWGQYRFLMGPYTNWNWEKIGPTPPIKTEKGWLEIIHGVSSSCSTVSYSLGAVLLDLEDPEKIIGRMESYLLTAEEPYEQTGRTPNCVFTTGAIADMEKRRLRVYYGAADTCIGLAEGDLDEIIDACLKGL